MKRRTHIAITEATAGTMLRDLLASRFAYRRADDWEQRIAVGRVLVNGEPVATGCVVQAGDVVESIADDIPEPPVNFDVNVLHADADILVVDKPANLPCHPAGRYFRHTLWGWLKEQHGLEHPAIVNRLDRETSGLLIVALNRQAEYRCRRQFAARRVHKEYLALVEGAFPPVLDAAGWMRPDPGSAGRRRWVFARDAGTVPAESLMAETRFQRLAEGHGVSLVKAVPITGRQHQIRATLCSMGFPVVGDKVYGVDPAVFGRFCTDSLTVHDWSRLRLRRQALHASRLEFRHPADNRSMGYESPLPAEMAELLGGQGGGCH